VARKKKTRVFVSYSRHDEALVRPLAGLLGIAADRVVFLDVTSLQPGDEWETEIINAVRESSVFVLCWCCESQKSEFVAREISTALLDPHKRMVPVLFCSIHLPEALAKRQWIDLSGRILHECGGTHAQTVAKEAPSAAEVLVVKKPDDTSLLDQIVEEGRLGKPHFQLEHEQIILSLVEDFVPNNVTLKRLRRVLKARAKHANSIAERARAYFERLGNSTP
jgi:hypothetical protein